MKIRQHLYSDLVISLFIFVGASIEGWFCLTHFDLTIRPDAITSGKYLLPSLNWATGHGFTSVLPIPAAIDDFLDQRTDSLAAKEIPAGGFFIKVTREHTFVSDRLYLLYSVAFVWRLLGVSWASLKLFLALVFGLVASLSYGVFRLGINRPISILCTLLAVTSPVLLKELPWLRSLCKAPFLLAAILIVGYVVSRRVRPRTLCGLAALLGLVIGLGTGFRQDVIIGLPLALGAVTIGAQLTQGGRWHRGLAAVLLMACFVIPAWPALRMTATSGGNNSFYLLQGFTRSCVREMGMERASYCPFYTRSDCIVHADIVHYRASLDRKVESCRPRNGFPLFLQALCRAPFGFAQSIPFLAAAVLYPREDPPLDIFSDEAEAVARSMVWDLYTTFPADVIGRWYATTLLIMRHLNAVPPAEDNDRVMVDTFARWHEPLARHLGTWGPWYALVSLLLIGARDLRLGFGVLILLLYSCGYPSLSFQDRHAFHMNFVSYWFPGFLLSTLSAALGKMSSAQGRAGVGALLRQRAWLRPFIRRAALFAAISLVAILAPLYAARLWQYFTVQSIVDRYVDAPLEPLGFDPIACNDSGETTYAPRGLPDLREPPVRKTESALAWLDLGPREPYVLVEYLVADMEVLHGSPAVSIEYEDNKPALGGVDDLECLLGAPYTFRYFFPVYRFSYSYISRQGAPAAMFRGITMGANCRIKGLYRVKAPRDFPVLMNVWLPSSRDQLRWYQGITLTACGGDREWEPRSPRPSGPSENQ